VREYLPFIKNPQKGFTLIELLVVLAILAVFVFIALASFGVFGRQVSLDTASQQIISTLQLARNQTLASEDETVYGVHFETDRYVLFKGVVYDPSDINNKETVLTSTEIYERNLAGGGDDVIFTRIRGNTTNTGNIKIKVIEEPSRTKTILINSLGQASIEEEVNPSDARYTDTRHLHFDPCPSIQNSTTLSLIFSVTSPVTNNITMATYFDAGKTEFNWEGKTTVDGSDQKIKVHTHFLDASSSIISIHRDRRYNNKALEIKIDNIRVVSYYDSVGNATIGAFCSDMSAQ
jgi:prepilin-type N-terminal cleavage/methylation domain-containing protein